MILTALVLAGVGLYIYCAQARLPAGRWASVASTVCGIASLYCLTAWIGSRHRPFDGPLLLPELRAMAGFVYMGQGYAWTLSCARQQRDAAIEGEVPLPSEPRDLLLPERELEKHTLILGTTGSGKSRLLELLVAQAIRRGDPTAVIDPKGDERLLARVYEECVRSGRVLTLVAPPYAQASVPYNPIANFAEVRDIADRIAALLPAGGDAEPFRNFAWEVTHATAQAMQRSGEAMTLVNLRRYALEDSGMLLRNLVRVVDPISLRGANAKRAAEQVASQSAEVRALLALIRRPADHTQKMVSALVPILSKLTAGSHRALLSPIKGGFAWRHLDVAYFFLGSLLGMDSAQAVAKMALLDFQSYVGVRYAYGGESKPISLFLDELPDVISPAFVHVLNKGRGAGVRLTMATQTLADLEVSLGSKAQALQVVGNVNSVVQFRAQSTPDAEAFSDLAGRRLLPAMSEGETYEPAMFTSGLERVEDFRALFSRQRMWREEPLVAPWAIMDLAPFHYFIRWGAYVARGVVPLLPPPPMEFVEGLKKDAAKCDRLGAVARGSDPDCVDGLEGARNGA